MTIPDEIAKAAQALHNLQERHECRGPCNCRELGYCPQDRQLIANWLTAVLPDITAAAVAVERIAGLIEARDLARAAARQSFNASTRWADEDTHEFAVYEAEGIALSRHADAIDARISALGDKR